MFTILDGFIIVFALILVLIGARRGFIGSIVRFFSGIIRLLLSILLAKPVATLISCTTKIDERLFDKYHRSASLISDKFNVNLVGMNDDSLSEFVGDALQDAKIPKLFRGLFQNIFSINAESINSCESVTLADMMGVAIANMIIVLISFVTVFLLLVIVGFVIKRLSVRMSTSTTLFARTNKWLGAILGFVKSVVIILVVLFVCVFIDKFNWFGGFISYIDNSFFVGPLFDLAKIIIDSSFDIGRSIEVWFAW